MSTPGVFELPEVHNARNLVRERYDEEPEQWLLGQAPEGTSKQLSQAGRRIGLAAPLVSMWWDQAAEGTTLRERQKIARDAAKRAKQAQAAELEAKRAANRARLERDRRLFYTNRSGSPVELVEIPDHGRPALLPVETYKAILDARSNERASTPEIMQRFKVSNPVVRGVLGPLTRPAVVGIDEVAELAQFRETNGRWPTKGSKDPDEARLARRLRFMRRGNGPQIVRYVADHLIPGWDYPVPVRTRSTPPYAAEMLDRVVAFREANPDAWPTKETAEQEWTDMVDLRAAARHDSRLVWVLDRRLPGWRYPSQTTAIRKS